MKTKNRVSKVLHELNVLIPRLKLRLKISFGKTTFELFSSVFTAVMLFCVFVVKTEFHQFEASISFICSLFEV